MTNFSINYDILGSNLAPKPIIFQYKDVQHKLKKVAFDVVRFVDSENIDGLWQIQKRPDGEYIVALYDLKTEEVSKQSSWNVISDKFGNINILYKNTPVTKVAFNTLGIKNSNVDEICKLLPERLAANKKLKDGLLLEISTEKRNELFKLYPELKE